MKLHNYIKLAVVALSLLMAVGAGYYLGTRSDDAQDNALLQELEQMRSEAEQAAVVKRVSQQMEEIAYQQKALSDSAAEEARQQSVLARNNARKAEEESRRARQAQQEAQIERQNAEREAKVAMEAEREAIMMRDEAQLQRQKSDHLMYLTIARTLSGLAVTNFDNRNTEIGKVLTLQAYRMLRDGGGNLYTSEMYRAVAESLGLLHSFNMPTHSMVSDLDLLPAPHIGCVAVSSYGEVMMLTLRKGQTRAEQKLLFADKSYYFKSVVPMDDYIILMDQAGSLYTMTYDGRISEKWQTLNDVSVKYMYRLKNNLIVVRCSDRLIWVNTKNHKRLFEYVSNKPMETIYVQRDNDRNLLSIYLFLDGGLCRKLSPVGQLESEMQLGYTEPCGEAFVDQDGLIFVGLGSGHIFHTMDGLQTNFINHHISDINGVYVKDSVCLSLSFDHKICISDLRLMKKGMEHEWVEPAAYSVTGWPWAVNVSSSPFIPMEIAWVGCSGGEVIQLPILMTEMGKALENAGIRNMTRAEWSEYVGNNLDYPY